MSEEVAERPPGQIVTFYSFKGGVGRSMALANAATWLARWDLKVLAVDWDLEAPGLTDYFRPWTRAPSFSDRARAPEYTAGAPSAGYAAATLESAGAVHVPGLADLLLSLQEHDRSSQLRWQDLTRSVVFPNGSALEYIGCGTVDSSYFEKVQQINYELLFGSRGFGQWIEQTRSEWIEQYDIVLIDSRTGVTDVGGVCTIHFPDILVGVYAANEQSLLGLKSVLQRAAAGHQRLDADRPKLIMLPLPSRDETENEYRLALQWRKRAAEELEFAFADWLPQDEDRVNALELLKIPYIPYWSFGERVPVVEERDPENPKTLAFAYQPLARLLAKRLDWKKAKYAEGSGGGATRDVARIEEARAQLRLREELQEQRRSARDELRTYIERVRERARTASYNLRGAVEAAQTRALRVFMSVSVLCIGLILLANTYSSVPMLHSFVMTMLPPDAAVATMAFLASSTLYIVGAGIAVAAIPVFSLLYRMRRQIHLEPPLRSILHRLDRLEAGIREIVLLDERGQIQARYESHVKAVEALAEELAKLY